MKLIQKIWNGMQSIHGSKSIHCAHKCIVSVINATTVQNDVIVRRFINSMNMVMGAQYDVIMQLMVGNNIMMYEYAIRYITTNLLMKCTSSYIMDDIERQYATRQS